MQTAPTSPATGIDKAGQANESATTVKETEPSRATTQAINAAPAAQQAPQTLGTPALSTSQPSDGAVAQAAEQSAEAAQETSPIEQDSQPAPAAPAMEAAPKLTDATIQPSKGQVTTGAVAAQPQIQPEASEPDAGPVAEKGEQPLAEKKVAEGAQRPQAAEKKVAEQVGVTTKAPDQETSGTKNAGTETAAKVAPSQAGQGQTGSGDADKKGHPEQKPQDKGNDQLQPLGAAAAQPPVVTPAPQPEAKPSNLQNALHESILTQIKDGVVTHDGKGNGQMNIRLNPGELGELKIEVRMEDNRLKVEVHAENQTVKDLLMSNVENLKEALASKNFTMQGFDVSTGGGSFNGPLPEQKRNSRQQTPRTAKGGGYQDRESARVNYLTGDVNNLLDVRF